MNSYHVRYACMALPLVFLGALFLHSNSLSSMRYAEPRSAVSLVELIPDTVSTGKDVVDLDIDALLLQPHRIPILPLEQLDGETLWLARCIYSETKRPYEQEAVAWVVRNRVETSYRGRRTYRDVVLDPFQFSAFNPDNPKRAYYASLGYTSTAPGWQRALSIAFHVRHAPAELRPFPVATRHFYSERSMVSQQGPDWASGLQPVLPSRVHHFDPRRFRFFTDVA